MNSQDLSNLQEAYLDVYGEAYVDWRQGELSSGMSPRERAKRRADAAPAKVRLAGGSDEEVSKARQRRTKIKRIGDEMDSHTGFGGVINKLLTPGLGDRAGAGPRMNRGEPNTERHQRGIDRRRKAQNEEYDIYDIILSHLLDEGYAETQEQAEAIMVNMSEDWREGILSEAILEYQPFKDKRKRVKSKVKKLESEKSGDPKDLGFRNARLQKRIDSMKTVLGKKNKEITSASQQKSYDSMAKGGFKHHDDPQSKYYIK